MRIYCVSLLLATTIPNWAYCSTTAAAAIRQLQTNINDEEERSHYQQKFDEWLNRYNDQPLSYQLASEQAANGHTDLMDEYEQRFQLFVSNSKKVEKHNEAYERGETSYKMTMDNAYALSKPFVPEEDEDEEEKEQPQPQDKSASKAKKKKKPHHCYRRKFDQWLERFNDQPLSDSLAQSLAADGETSAMEEYERRLETFATNAKKVKRHNKAFEAGFTSYKMTVDDSPFADLTDEEFRLGYLMESQDCSATHVSSVDPLSMFVLDKEMEQPPSIDWRTKGILTPIKNQKSCGSCWTFSTTGTLESHTCLHNPNTIDCATWNGLAEQQLLDCSSSYDNHGCNGGLPSHAFEYLKEKGALYPEELYPYRAESEMLCQPMAPIPPSTMVGRVAEVYNITSRDETDLVRAIGSVGPVSVAFQVAEDFRLYSHGVYDSYDQETNSTICKSGKMDVNHAVVAVGYGVSEANDEPFYIVRNSWGNTWGMEGYFWIKRGENLCGISDCASFPIVPELQEKVRGNVVGGMKDVGSGVVTPSLRG